MFRIPKRTAKENRRYYLHRKLKKAGYQINVESRTIYIPFSLDIHAPKDAIELRDTFHYSLQIIID
jgi:hypothetical protein